MHHNPGPLLHKPRLRRWRKAAGSLAELTTPQHLRLFKGAEISDHVSVVTGLWKARKNHLGPGIFARGLVKEVSSVATSHANPALRIAAE